MTNKKNIKRPVNKEKRYILTESQMNKQRKYAYEKIMRTIGPMLNEAEEQEELNELFGFGNSVKEPEQKLTADVIKETSTEELADVLAEHFNFWMAKTGDNIDKAITNAITALHSHCSENKEGAKKVMQSIVIACRKAANGTAEFAKNSAKAVGRVLLLGCALCVKFTANSISYAKEALMTIYKEVSEKLSEMYNSLKEKAKAGAEWIGEKAQLLCKLSMAACYLVAHKFAGAAETVGKWVKELFEDIKDGVVLACMILRSWFTAKAQAVQEFLKEKAGAVKQACVETWNKLDKKVRKAWNAMAEKVVSLYNNIQCTLSKLGDKISNTMTKAGDAIIAGKDKTLVAGIGKAVKMLSKNYSEDDVVAIVRKAYNEGLSFEADGSCIINEAYYSNTRLKHV